MYSLFQHPFITYTFVLSSALTVLVAVVLRLAPPRGAHRMWLYMVPLVVPVLSYVTNYVIIGKTCEYGHSYHRYIGALGDFPSYHLLCQLNHRMIPWVAPASLAWLAVSLVIYGFTWYRTRQLLKRLPAASEGNTKLKAILDELCRREGMKPPALKVLDYSQPVIFTGGSGNRAVTVSTGTLNLLEDGELRAALAHELAHIRRKGHIVNWLLVLCRNLTLFSPGSLWSYAAVRNEEEKACDAVVASRFGLGIELASAIVKFMRHGNAAAWAPPLASLLPGGGPGVARVEHLLDAHPTGADHSRWAYVSLAVLIVGLVFIC